MELKIHKCDACGKVTDNLKKAIGWISFPNGLKIVHYFKDNAGDGIIPLRYARSNESIELCSTKCFKKFLKEDLQIVM